MRLLSEWMAFSGFGVPNPGGADPPSGLGPRDGFAYLAGVVGWDGACVPEGVELELEVLGVLLLSASELDFSEAAFATRAAIMTGHPVRFNIRPISAREVMSLRIDISGFLTRSCSERLS